jgi:Fur family ferric uptake transcriptional regulator
LLQRVRNKVGRLDADATEGFRMTELATALREHGHRLTTARRLTWEALEGGGGHLTAHEVADRVHRLDPNINLSSVYRSLSLLADIGLARESQLGVDGASRWEPIHSDDHFHLVCRSCGRVDHHAGEAVSSIRRHLASDHGFEAEAVELVARGLCGRCRGA